MDEVLIRNALNSMLEATKDDATPIIRRLARVQARAALDTLASAPAEPLPDIGPDPFKGPREDDRYEGSRLRLRAAYAQQQKGVPDQTALVWRYDLGTVLEMAIRLKSILADDEEPASAPAGDAFADAGKPIASAGDGVVRGYELAERHNAQVDAGTLDIDPRHDSNHPLHDIVCGWCGKVHSAALARPRAAVGEQSREGIALRLCGMVLRNNLPPEEERELQEIILALQSPPAKVEG